LNFEFLSIRPNLLNYTKLRFLRIAIADEAGIDPLAFQSGR
jgi:hypothetical protein